MGGEKFDVPITESIAKLSKQIKQVTGVGEWYDDRAWVVVEVPPSIGSVHVTRDGEVMATTHSVGSKAVIIGAAAITPEGVWEVRTADPDYADALGGLVISDPDGVHHSPFPRPQALTEAEREVRELAKAMENTERNLMVGPF